MQKRKQIIEILTQFARENQDTFSGWLHRHHPEADYATIRDTFLEPLRDGGPDVFFRLMEDNLLLLDNVRAQEEERVAELEDPHQEQNNNNNNNNNNP